MRRRKKRIFMWKRCLAMSVAAITLATGLNYPGLKNVFADETSGYEIDVSYSEESNQVILRGNMENVPSNITLLDMTDEDGTEYEPDEFTAIVAENGKYIYTLTYSETVPETGKTVEKEETVDVVVDEVEETAEETEEADPDKTEAETQETETVVTEEQQEATEETEEIQPAARSAASILVADSGAASGASTRASLGNYNFNSVKTWSIDDFPTRWMSSSYESMNYNTDPPVSSVTITNDLPKREDNTNGAMFRFGNKRVSTSGSAHWLQQGAAFSDISFDFTKDFALTGYIRVGEGFGADNANASPNATNITIDGGATISFVPANQVDTAKENARYARGAGYRLGAYRTLPNSIVCEYDMATDPYYQVGDYRNFVIGQTAYHQTGDYNYGGGAWIDVTGKDIWSAAEHEGWENVSHIGITTTNANNTSNPANSCVASKYTDRVTVGRSSTGSIKYQITYSHTEGLYFHIWQSDMIEREVFMSINDINSLLNTLGDQKKNMKLVFTFGAAYISLDNFINNASWFSTGSNTGAGQIDIWATEAYVNPDLQATQTQVRWLDSGNVQAGADANHNAYYTGSAYNYTNKTYWPVAGDRIFTQFSFVPRTDIMPQPDSIASGTLKLSVGNFSVKAGNGTVLSQQPGNVKLFYRRGSTGNFTEYNSNSGIPVSGKEEIYVRVGLTLPTLDNNSTIQQYSVSGTITADYSVGKSKAKYEVPLMSENAGEIKVSRGPIFQGWNGVSDYTIPRVVRSSDNITNNVLQNIANRGNQTNAGYKESIHYGLGFLQLSTGDLIDVRLQQGNSYEGAKFSYRSAAIGSLSQVKQSGDLTFDSPSDQANIALDFSEDRKYILDYTLVDGTYRSQISAGKPTGNNTNRAKTTGKRVIWVSNNVEVQNGYEFYARQNVTLPAAEFIGFEQAGNKAEYYKKIAEAAEAKIFKTSSYDFNDLVNGNYQVSLNGSVGFSGLGTTTSHQGILNAINNPGVPQSVTIRYRASDGTNVDRTINLTVGNSVSAITVTDASENQTVKHYKDDRTFSVSFNSDKSVNENATTRYAIFRRDSDESTLGICETGSVASNGTVTRITGKQVYGSVRNVTANVTNTEIILNITHSEHTNRIFKVYMWNEKNGNLNLSANGTAIDSQYATIGVNADSALKGLNLPVSVTTEYIIPKVSTKYENGVSTIEETNKYELFYEETSFTVTGTFKLEGSTKEAFDSLKNGGDLKVALYKKNPTGNNTGNYVIWATSAGAVANQSGKVSAPVINKVNNYEFTVSFTITNYVDNNGNDSLTNQWDDGAKYRIFAWTHSNESVRGNTDFGEAGDQFQWQTAITTVPSTTTTMTGILGSQVESIVKYPKQVSMMDNVRNNNHIYSSDQQITLYKLSGVELPDTDMGIDVLIQDIETSGSNSFNITRGTENIAIKAMTGVTAGGGKDVPRTGLVGTLHFDSNNANLDTPDDTLAFYFRSVNETYVNDGGPFEGQITFLFRRGSGSPGTNGTTVTN